MSDDLNRGDDRVRPGRETPMRPARPDESPVPRRREYDDEDDRPRPRPRSSSDGGMKTLLIILAIVGILGFCLIAGVVGGMFALVRSVRNSVGPAIAKAQATNNYKQVALGVLAYHDKYQRFPPVAMPTADGKKQGLSWRVAILPFMGPDQEALYKQFKIDKSWDDPDNMKLAPLMPYFYAPGDGSFSDRTHVRVFTGNRAMFDLKNQRRIADITDGLTNTIMLAEAADPVLWIKPDELPFDPKKPPPALGMPGNDFFVVAMGDGSVRFLKKSISPEKLRLAIDSADGQPVDLDQ
jgi:hypothetical protein